MKYYSIFIICLFSVFLHAQNWNQLSSFPGDARDDASSFTINNLVYCGLGMNTGFSCTSDFKVFDLNTETWSNGVSLPIGEERQYANGFSHQGFGYIFCGVNGNNYLADCWKFNPINASWTALPDLPATGKAGAVSFIIGDTVYIIGGKTTGGTISNEVWAFDLIQEQWFQKSNLPFDGIWRGVSFSWNNTGIVGLGKLNNGTFNTSFYEYQPATDSWQNINQLSLTPTTYSMFAQIGKNGFVYGGALENLSYSNQFTRIDLETWATTTLSPFPADARKGGVAFVNNSDFFITTGVSSQARLNETWKASYILELSSEDAKHKVQLYPNPITNQLIIQSDMPIETDEIYDNTGKIISTTTVESNQINLPVQLDNGHYMVHLKGENTHITTQICVQQ